MRMIGSLVLMAMMTTQAAALTISFSGDDMSWSGSNVPPSESGQLFQYDGLLEFLPDFEKIELHLATSSPSAPALTEELSWGFLDTPTERIYNGTESRIELLSSGDFTQTPPTEANFAGLVDAIRLEYYPDGISQNFDTSLSATTGYVVVPEPAAVVFLLLGLLFACLVVRRPS